MVNSGEKIIDYIAGIMRAGFGVRGYEVLGVGKVITSENAMLFTSKGILFITVPLPGAETMVSGVDIPMWQWLLAKKDIESKTKEMISSMSAERILKSNPKNYYVSYEEIKAVKFGWKFLFFSSTTISITRNDGKTLKYTIRDKQDFERAKVILKRFS